MSGLQREDEGDRLLQMGLKEEKSCFRDSGSGYKKRNTVNAAA